MRNSGGGLQDRVAPRVSQPKFNLLDYGFLSRCTVNCDSTHVEVRDITFRKEDHLKAYEAPIPWNSADKLERKTCRHVPRASSASLLALFWSLNLVNSVLRRLDLKESKKGLDQDDEPLRIVLLTKDSVRCVQGGAQTVGSAPGTNIGNAQSSLV
jgi:hypothetical protein